MLSVVHYYYLSTTPILIEELHSITNKPTGKILSLEHQVNWVYFICNLDTFKLYQVELSYDKLKSGKFSLSQAKDQLS